jgi:hypothetical protein
MPIVAAFVDELREAFGSDLVNGWLRGRDGAWLCARENGARWCRPGRRCKQCKEEAGEWRQ